jgi:hypothetical protein
MLGRIVLTGAAIAALGVGPALAGPPILPLILGAKHCFESAQTALVTMCAFQTAEGDRNKATTKQTTEYSGNGHSLQLAITYQDGDDNRSHTEQVGEDQFSLTAQVGNGNSAYTYQKGSDQFSGTIQKGDGNWAATSSIGNDTHTFVYQSN